MFRFSPECYPGITLSSLLNKDDITPREHLGRNLNTLITVQTEIIIHMSSTLSSNVIFI